MPRASNNTINVNATGGILGQSKSTKTGNYTILSTDINNVIALGSGATADSAFTLDVSLLTTNKDHISFINESDYRLEIVVSNTGTMTFNNSTATNYYTFKGDNILTINGDTSTNANIVAE